MALFNQIGPYRVIREIGQGAVSKVVLAKDTRNDRTVTLKLYRSKDSEGRLAAEQVGTHLQDEFSKTTELVPRVYEQGVADGYQYIAFEYVQGESLSQVVARGALSPSQAAAIALQIAKFLETAHGFKIAGSPGNRERGFVHGDLKPSNVLLLESGAIRVIDFGIAKPITDTDTVHSPVTAFATIAYAAPERLETGRVNPHSDLWALGVMFYEMLYGARPFDELRGASLDRLIRSRRITIPVKEGIPESVRAIAARLLAPVPEQRYANATEVVADLAQYLEAANAIDRPATHAAKAANVDPGSIVLIWDPEVVWPSDYAALVEALGDLARASGGEGVRRVRHETFGSPVRDGAFV